MNVFDISLQTSVISFKIKTLLQKSGRNNTTTIGTEGTVKHPGLRIWGVIRGRIL